MKLFKNNKELKAQGYCFRVSKERWWHRLSDRMFVNKGKQRMLVGTITVNIYIDENGNMEADTSPAMGSINESPKLNEKGT